MAENVQKPPECNTGENQPDEETVMDPQEKFRRLCRMTKECKKLFEKLETCNNRVNSRSKTAETCFEEIVDYTHCVDHCAAPRFFGKLK